MFKAEHNGSEYYVIANKSSIYIGCVKYGEKEYQPLLRSDVNGEMIFSGIVYEDRDTAWDVARMAYHKLVGDLEPGVDRQVELDLIVSRHWKSYLMYGDENESDKELYDALSRPDGEVQYLTINTLGVPVDGGRRRKMAQLVNEECKRNNQPEKFKYVPAKIRHYEYEVNELSELLRDNQGQRVVTKRMRLEVASQFEEMYKADYQRMRSLSAKVRLGQLTAEEQKFYNEVKALGRSDDRVAEAAGFKSRADMHQSETVIEYVDNARAKGDSKLASELEKQLEKAGSTPTSTLVKNESPEVVAKAIEKVNEASKTGKKKKLSVAAAEVKAEIASESTNGVGVQHTEKELRIRTAVTHKVNPKDDRLTPEFIIQLAQEVFSELSGEDITTDAFADLTKLVPAKKHITCVENAFNPDTRIEGNVWANILWSDKAKCLKALDREITNGSIKRLIICSEPELLFTVSTQQIIDKHSMSLLTWANKDGRLDYKPGEFLLSQDEKAVSGSNRYNTCFLFYSFDPRESEVFFNHFGQYGLRWLCEDDKRYMSQLRTDSIECDWQQSDTSTWTATYQGSELFVRMHVDLEKIFYSVSVNSQDFPVNFDRENDAKAMAMGVAIQNANLF